MSDRAKLAADRFRAMAERIERNGEDGFGGAILAIPPGEGDAVEMLILDSAQDIAQYWGLIQTRATIALRAADDKARMQTGFPR